MGYLGSAFGLDDAVVSAYPEILLCHPKMLRFSSSWATDAMRKEAKQKKFAGFFYASALAAMLGSFWFAGALYRDGLDAQDQAFEFERERQQIAAKLSAGPDAADNQTFLKDSIRAAGEVDATAPSLREAFQIIQSANLPDRIELDKLVVSPTDERGVSELRIHGKVSPVVANGHGKIYSSTLKFLKGVCDSFSAKNSGLVQEAKIETLGMIVGANPLATATVTEPASSTEKMPFQILIRMWRG